MDLKAVLPFNVGCTKGLIKTNGYIASVLCIVSLIINASSHRQG